MQKVNSYRCVVCGLKFTTLKKWGAHMAKEHPDVIFPEYSDARYFYFQLTGKKVGSCIICKSETEWNEGTQKYARFCDNPECKEKYRNIFKNRMINKHGKVHLLNDPDQQRKMLAAKKNSGKYKFNDGSEIGYHSSYELDFLRMLDRFFAFSGDDIMSPSPHTYYYDYKNLNDKENEGRKFYIPDFYIPSANLEIEIKQSTNNHHKMLRIDKVKELCKDEMMKTLPEVNYFKILEKDYTAFYDYLEDLNDVVELADNDIAIEANSYNPISYSTDKLKLSSFKRNKMDYSNLIDMKKSYPNIQYIVDVAVRKVVDTKGISGDVYLDSNNKLACYIMYKEVSGSSVKWISNIYVDKSKRRNGLGRQMVTSAIRRCSVTNVSIDINDAAVIDLFIKAGFTEYSRNTTNLFMSL